MDIKTISFGVAVVAASVGGAAVVSQPSTETLTPKTVSLEDVAVTEIAKAGPVADERRCVKDWVTVKVAKGPELKWLCDGIYLASVQAELDKLAGEDGTEITYKPTIDGEDVKYNAEIVNGTIRPKPAPIVVDEPVVEEVVKEP